MARLPYQFSDIKEISLKKNDRGSFTYTVEGTYKNTEVKLIAENVALYQTPITEFEPEAEPMTETLQKTTPLLFKANKVGLIFYPFNVDDKMVLFIVEENGDENGTNQTR